ncbi:MAG: hypothetical protein Kow0063_24320 [Anaerolineae bacterium]
MDVLILFVKHILDSGELPNPDVRAGYLQHPLYHNFNVVLLILKSKMGVKHQRRRANYAALGILLPIPYETGP